MDKVWYTIEKIIFDEEIKKISGNCIEGPYKGEVEIYIPPFVLIDDIVSGKTIKALCGPGMTMSLPPQLMGCSYIEVVEYERDIEEAFDNLEEIEILE